MSLHEVKMGDLVTFTTEKGKKVNGKVIHRHTDADKQHLMGHVNVQVDDEGSYPHTIHVSKLKKITEEAIMENMKENIAGFLQGILAGENTDARAMLDNILADKINNTLSALKPEVAGQMFATESVDEDETFITDDEFNDLSPEEQGEYEMVEFEDDADAELEEGEVKTDNKAKKNEYVKKVGREAPGERPAFSYAGGQQTDARYGRYLIKKKGMKEAIIAPRPTPSPEATAAAKTDIEKARKKREAVLASAKAELASTSKADLKKALYSKMYKTEEVEQMDELSKKTRDSYVAKRGSQLSSMKYGPDKNYSLLSGKKQANAVKGIKQALNKEDVEHIDELSKKTMKSYVKKATTSANRNWAKGAKEEDKSMATDGMKYPAKQERHMKAAGASYKIADKRETGIKLAKQKMRENIEMMSEEEHDYYKDYMAGNIDHATYKGAVRDFQRRSGYSNFPKQTRAPEVKEPHSVHINGKKWKSFSSHGHATNVANKIMSKGQGHKITIEKD